MIDDPEAFGQLVNDEEWKILGADEMTEESLALKKHKRWLNKNNPHKAQAKKKKKVKVCDREDGEYDVEEDSSQEEGEDSDDQDAKDQQICEKLPQFRSVLDLANQLRAQFPQFSIDGERNIWIVKPAGSSRGRGICLFKNLVEIIDMTKQIETQYIV